MPARSSPARKEYSRLRSIARKRIDRLVEAGIWSHDKANRERLRLLTPSKFVPESDLAMALDQLGDFLYHKPSTIPAARQAREKRHQQQQAAAKTLQIKYGLNLLVKTDPKAEEKQMKAFGDYMDWLKDQAIDDIFDSYAALEDFEELRATAAGIQGVDVTSILKDFKFWLDHKEDLTEAKEIPDEYWRKARGDYGQTSKQLRNALARYRGT